jgi:hypothetical protein
VSVTSSSLRCSRTSAKQAASRNPFDLQGSPKQLHGADPENLVIFGDQNRGMFSWNVLAWVRIPHCSNSTHAPQGRGVACRHEHCQIEYLAIWHQPSGLG